MHDHGLFQAICRVNRLDGEEKDFGYIVDYTLLRSHPSRPPVTACSMSLSSPDKITNSEDLYQHIKAEISHKPAITATKLPINSSHTRYDAQKESPAQGRASRTAINHRRGLRPRARPHPPDASRAKALCWLPAGPDSSHSSWVPAHPAASRRSPAWE